MKIRDEVQHRKDLQAFYARLAGEYDQRPEPYFVNIYRLYDRCLRALVVQGRFGGPFGLVLDAGCGTGRHLTLAARYCRRAIGLDVTPEILAVAAGKVAAQGLDNVELLCGDVTRLPLGASSVDCLYAYGDVIGHIPRYQEMIAEAARVLRPLGILSFECENKWYPGLLWNLAELRRALADPRSGHIRYWDFKGGRLPFNTFCLREMADLLSGHGFRIVASYGYDFFTYVLPIPERYHLSDRNGPLERMALSLGRIDLFFSRLFPVNRFGYSRVIFAERKG